MLQQKIQDNLFFRGLSIRTEKVKNINQLKLSGTNVVSGYEVSSSSTTWSQKRNFRMGKDTNYSWPPSSLT